MSIWVQGGDIGVVIEKTAGGVHKTSVHVIPIWLIVLILAAIALPIWMARRGRRDSN
jgi:hypothetical protein